MSTLSRYADPVKGAYHNTIAYVSLDPIGKNCGDIKAKIPSSYDILQQI
jgi:hypothetical protein